MVGMFVLCLWLCICNLILMIPMWKSYGVGVFRSRPNPNSCKAVNNASILFSYSFPCRGYIQKIMKSLKKHNLLQNHITILPPFGPVILVIRSIHGWMHHIQIAKRSWSRRSPIGGGWFQRHGGSIYTLLPLQPSYGLQRLDHNHDGAGYEKILYAGISIKTQKAKMRFSEFLML